LNLIFFDKKRIVKILRISQIIKLFYVLVIFCVGAKDYSAWCISQAKSSLPIKPELTATSE